MDDMEAADSFLKVGKRKLVIYKLFVGDAIGLKVTKCDNKATE